MRPRTQSLRPFWPLLFLVLPCPARAEPVDFDVPAQSAARAVVAWSQQARIEVLFSFSSLSPVRSRPVQGHYEPEDALVRLLDGTGFTARRTPHGKFIIARPAVATGTLQGTFVTQRGVPAAGLRVAVGDQTRVTRTDARGRFRLAGLPPGAYQLSASGRGFQPFSRADVHVEPDQVVTLDGLVIVSADDTVQLDPYLVEGRLGPSPFGRELAMNRTATGDLDLPRSENDALPFTVFTRTQLARSGVVDLNEFLQRELLDADAITRPPEQDGNQDAFVTGSSNLTLRGYGSEETIVLVNGRRLPETANAMAGSAPQPPDVNIIPLSLVQRVEVLPISAAALYSGNAVGGVINIILRTDANVSLNEVTTTYTNALGGFDAPQMSLSLQLGRTLLDGRLRYRLAVTDTRMFPPTEAELGYGQLQAQRRLAVDPEQALYRATPNVRSADGMPLFGPGSPAFTSVAPGADGSATLADFAGRAGVPSTEFFTAPEGGLATSPESFGHPYGRKQDRRVYFGSVAWDVRPWLEVGVDATFAQTVITRGYNVFPGDLALGANSPLNPFGQDVTVTLNESARRLGPDYNEARIDLASAVFGTVFKLPSDWRVSLDAQLARNVTRYRGLAGVNHDRWQHLVDTGRYNPLRDTQAYGPPDDFYDEALVYFAGPGRFTTLGDYRTLDAAVRVGTTSLPLPTGRATLNLGADYRRNELKGYTEEPRFGDGSLAYTPNIWLGRAIQRYSFFGEFQAPALPARFLPRWLPGVEADLAARYVAADSSAESNLAPAGGLKFMLPAGFTLRTSYSQANRFPNPHLSRRFVAPRPGGGIPGDPVLVRDPLRNQQYVVQAFEELNPKLRTEASSTITAGLLFQRGKDRRIRAALDFVDTRKANELVSLDAQTSFDFETLFPGRVTRAALAPGDAHAAGLATAVLTGPVNLASRHSQEWDVSIDYEQHPVAGGTLELHARSVYLSRYDRESLPGEPVVDELRAPDAFARNLLRFRANFGAGWFNPDWGFGVDAHYFHSRVLPRAEWDAQGGDRVQPYWSVDSYLQCNLGRLLFGPKAKHDLRLQLRVNNVTGFDFPKYANDASGSGVQAYTDWRGRTYSLSLTSTF